MTKIYVCGIGAVGSKLVMGLGYIRSIEWNFVELDKIDESNVKSGTSVYPILSIGQTKISYLSRMLWERYSVKVESGLNERLTDKNLFKIKNADLVLDCFDNFTSRKLLVGFPNVLHIGVSMGVGAVLWEDAYAMGEDVEGERICTNQLGVPIIDMTVAAAMVAVRGFISNGKKLNAVTNEKSIKWL